MKKDELFVEKRYHTKTQNMDGKLGLDSKFPLFHSLTAKYVSHSQGCNRLMGASKLHTARDVRGPDSEAMKKK